MNEWQPIETAPKDGSKVLILELDSVHDAVYLSRKDIWVSPDGAYGYDPTHWMPMPDPPKKTK